MKEECLALLNIMIRAAIFLSVQCLQQYVQLSIKEGGGAPITCPDMACRNTGVLLDSEVCLFIQNNGN